MIAEAAEQRDRDVVEAGHRAARRRLSIGTVHEAAKGVVRAAGGTGLMPLLIGIAKITLVSLNELSSRSASLV